MKKSPLNAKIYLSFLCIMSIAIFLFAQGMAFSFFDFFPKTGLPRDPSSAIWFRLAQIFALGFPVLLIIVFRKYGEVKKTFLPFLVVLIFQILTEIILSKYSFSSLIIPNALFYISFRLCQLWSGFWLISQSKIMPKAAILCSSSIIMINFFLWCAIFVRLSKRLFLLFA
jgi:hypothetical protein